MTTGALQVTSISNPSQQIASSAIGFFNSVELTADQIISELPNMADEDLLEARQQVDTLGYMSWRVEAACDAVVVKRSQPRAARGRHDLEGQQVAKAVQQYANLCAVSPRAIYENASIHETFFSSASASTREFQNGSLRHLREKDFYRAALCTDDPWATIETFAKLKSENPFFSTKDAWRMLKERKAPPLDETVPALCDQEDVLAAWEGFQGACRQLISVAPRLQNLISGYLEEVQYELTLPSQSVEETIYDLIRQGYDEADQIAARMKRDRIHVTVWLNRLCEIGKMESFEKERAPGARGQARTGYREIDS
jgi:hypothetical protein